eukprot:m.90038 g.90038  ORF g.90038 m.90038 type:complete len:564 (-) comp13254_c0_seq2:1623-3314(-)
MMVNGVRDIDRKAVRSTIMRGFRTQGLYMKSAAVNMLEKVLLGRDANLDEMQIKRAITMVANEIQNQALESNLIGEDVMEKVLAKWKDSTDSTASDLDITRVMQVVSAFKVPKFAFRNDRKQFVQLTQTKHAHAARATSKAQSFRDRVALLTQRTLRDPLFAPTVEGVQRTSQYSLTPLSALLGIRSNESEDDDEPLVVLGMITQLEEGSFYLEGLDGKVPLDVKGANFAMGLFTEHCIVICEGRYQDETFYATNVGFPPPEPRSETLRYHASQNFFGGTPTPAERMDIITEFETSNKGAMFICFSDVWLDKPLVLSKLRRVFEGFNGMGSNLVFVFMGNFLSEPRNANSHRVLTDCLNSFCDLILEFEDIQKNANFIFIPGTKDVGGSNILPRRPIPGYCSEKIRSKVPHCHFTTNPCRVRYCTQDLVFFREDLVNKMKRNCITPPSGRIDDEGAMDASSNLVKTVVDQAHLCPLPPHVSPVYWEHDHAMLLYPPPDVLVLGDKFDAYNLTYEECLAFNPGSFYSSDFWFMVYSPAQARIDPTTSMENKAAFESRVEFSQVP